MLDLKLIDLNSMADCVHTSGVFSLDEMAELYKLRINLHQFGQSSRVERRFALMFHAGAEYSSRPNDVVRSLVKAGLPIGDGNVINFSDTCNIKWQTLMQYSAILLFSMETRSKGLCGDVLAEYVDHGGCVVMCQALGCVGGKIMTDQYMPVRRREPTDGEFRSFHLGKVHTPSHPLFDDVASVKVRCGPNFVWNCEAVEGATVIAEWNDGTILACERECGKGRVLMLNLYPVSTSVVVVGIDKEGDGRILFDNVGFDISIF